MSDWQPLPENRTFFKLEIIFFFFKCYIRLGMVVVEKVYPVQVFGYNSATQLAL